MTSFSQIKLDGQIGGSNYLGMSLNTAFDILNSKSGYSYLTPSLGVGFLAQGREMRTAIFHFGLNYQMNRFGYGVEVSGFSPSPFFGNGQKNFDDILVYPNFNYTIFSKTNWYYKFSMGTYLAYSRYADGDIERNTRDFNENTILGAGFSLGFRFITMPEIE